MLRLLHLLRAIGHASFRRFGCHCATHQIRVILISCVVITSLFYPALAIYSSSQPLSLSLFDAFAPRNPASDANAYSDIAHLWSGHDHLKVHQDAMSRVKCRAARALRVEQLFIHNPVMDDTGALNHRLLQFALSLETRLNGALSTGDHPCLKRADGRCFIISPSLFWNRDEDALLADTNILDTLNNSKNVTVDGITITPQMVLAGRTTRDHRVAMSTFDFAAFLVLTYFFPESDCLSTSEHASWKQSLSSLVSRDADIIFQSQGPTLIALEFGSRGKNGAGLAAFVNLAYLYFFIYVVWSVRRMDAVHSRLGITFTALVEIAVSTITSLSVCALVGFKIKMVPWELLPIVIVFVGAENMFNLVDAVGKTSVTLPVKQRIAEGLSRAGTSNTLKVLSYIFMLGLMGFFSLGAVREFCIFAIVVLVAHWFLAHTFFMAVLSIDLQRLELEELLRHDPTVVSNTSQKVGGVEHLPTSRWRRLVNSFQALLKGRAATNISLLTLLAITATLYYMTYFSSLAAYDPRLRTTTIVVPQEKTPMSVESMRYSTAGYIWRKMNPSQHPLLHLRIEMPAVVTPLPTSNDAQQTEDHKSLYLRNYIHTFLWLHKIMILPIAGTTSMLYFLLLYLLKDAELLEAQRNHEGPDSLDADAETNTLQGQMSFLTLPRAFTSDVELIAPSKDGHIVSSVGLGNELMIWRANQSSFIPVVVEEALLKSCSARSTISSIAVEEDGDLFAAGTKTGTIFVWSVEKQAVRFLHTLRSDPGLGGVADLRFLRPSPINQEKPPALIGQACAAIIAVLENGAVVKWVLDERPRSTYLKPNHQAPTSRVFICTVMPDADFFVAFIFDDGFIELMEVQRNELLIGPECLLQIGGMSDTITEVHVCRLKLKGNTKTMMAVTTESRKVLLWDLYSKEQICNIECSENPRRPRVIQGCRDVCRTCGQLPLDNLFLAFAVEQSVRFYQLVLQDHVRHCSCTTSLRQRSSSHNETSALKTASNAQSLRSRLSPASEAISFPVSGHGIYPRRSEGARRSSEIFMVRFPSEDYESISILGANVLKPHGQHGSNSHWRHHSVTHLFDISCEKGDWDVACRKAVGLRRKERTKQKSKVGSGQTMSSCGLPISTLDRWEMWIFEPATLRLQTCALSAIVSKDHVDGQPPSIPRMPFTRVSSLFVASTYALAGFGNTIGMFTFCSA
ncbi:hypothetical protein APHAL10511_007107 [Amanita phalloides]|nr:hypothetical protein APHAL10511_007107 [Amanita phalloides]